MTQVKNDPFIFLLDEDDCRRALFTREGFLELLGQFIPPEWKECITLDMVRRIDDSFIFTEYESRETDLIYCIRVMDMDIYFYLLLTLDTPDEDSNMSLRMFLYVTKLMHTYMPPTPEGQEEEPDAIVPMVVPILLFKSKDDPAERFRDKLKSRARRSGNSRNTSPLN